MHQISALTDCKQRSSTVSNITPAASVNKKLPQICLCVWCLLVFLARYCFNPEQDGGGTQRGFEGGPSFKNASGRVCRLHALPGISGVFSQFSSHPSATFTSRGQTYMGSPDGFNWIFPFQLFRGDPSQRFRPLFFCALFPMPPLGEGGASLGINFLLYCVLPAILQRMVRDFS